jgi:FkbM family methyltransferase
MKEEAVRFHRIPAERVVVTGAAAFDHWFDWRPSTSREAFCERIGLRSDRPYLLYLCSSRFIAPDEVPFVHRWAERIRASHNAVGDAGILVRPHPQNADQWRGIDLSALRNVIIWPRAGSAPVDVESRNEYFDSMYHSAAVVGLNTTAEIESAIVGRGVFTALTPEFRDTQEGTLHFRHLREVNGGLVHVACDLAEHVAQLERALEKSTEDAERCRRFVQAFVRPHGLEVPATPRLVQALETLAGKRGTVGWRAPLWAPLVRARLSHHAVALASEAKSDRQSYAARLVAKTTRVAKQRSRAADSSRGTVPGAGDVVRQQRIERAVTDFRKMGEVDRREFVRSVIHEVPFGSLLDLRTALKPQRLDYDRADIYLHVTNKTETFRVKACAKEPFTIEWIHTHIKRGDVLFDIGANVGAYSLVAARKPDGGARVYAFEASYANVAALCANVALNHAGADVTPVPVALSGATAMGVFNLRDLESGSARHGLGDQMPEDGQVAWRQPVMTFRLDDLVDRFSLPTPNHIKMDVDGGELDVLAGACRTLSSPALRSMLIEVAIGSSAGVTQAMERHGFSLASRFTVTNRAGQQAVWYGLFERQG